MKNKTLEFHLDWDYRIWESGNGQILFKIFSDDGESTGKYIIYLVPLDENGKDLLINNQECKFGITIVLGNTLPEIIHSKILG